MGRLANGIPRGPDASDEFATSVNTDTAGGFSSAADQPETGQDPRAPLPAAHARTEDGLGHFGVLHRVRKGDRGAYQLSGGPGLLAPETGATTPGIAA